MKNKIIVLSVIMAFVAFTSCKKEVSSNSSIVQTETYEGKELSSEFDTTIDSLIAQMTIEEKIGMLHGNSMFTSGGVERLGIPELKMVDGPLGIREEISRNSWASAGLDNDFATYYPAAGSVAATWNPELSYTF